MESFFNSLSSFSYLSLSLAIKSLFVGATLSVLFFGFKRYFKNRYSEIRYFTLWGILALMVIVPIISATISINLFTSSLSEIVPVENLSNQLLISDKSKLEKSDAKLLAPSSKASQVAYIPNTNYESQAMSSQVQSSSESNWSLFLRFIPVLLSLVWLSVTILMLYRLYRSYDKILRLKHSAKLIDDMGYSFIKSALSKIDLSRPVRIGTSDDVAVPIAAGFKYPMIILPTHILHELSKNELEIIILHELAHLKRWDDFGKLGQRLIEAFAFFNPAIRWVGQQLDFEREVACDKFVIGKIGSTNKYAECLTKLMQVTNGTGTTLIPGFYSSKKQIFKRFEEMFMNDKNKRSVFSKQMLATVLSIIVLFSITLIQVTPAIAIPGSYLTFQEVTEIFNDSVTEQQKNQDELEKNIPANEYTLFDDNTIEDAPILAIDDIDAFDDIDGIVHINNRNSNIDKDRRSNQGLLSSLVDKTQDFFNFHGTSITHNDDGEISVHWNERSRTCKVRIYGDIEFTDDDKWIKSLSRDGYFSVYEKNRRTERELDVEVGKNGELDIVYYVDDEKEEFDQDGKEWVAEILEQLFYKTDFNADKRVARMFEQGGADAVLDYTENIDSDYILRIYISELLLQDKLSEKDYSRIMSNVERDVESDYEKAELLISISPTIEENENLIGDYVEVVRTIESDYETRRVLSELSLKKDTDPKIILAVLEIASEIESDYERAELLIDLSKICRDNPELNEQYIAAMKNISSDYETRRVFSAISKNAVITEKSLQELLYLADDIDSDYEKAEFLIELSDLIEDDEEKQLQLFDAIGSLDSDYETRRVLDHYRFDCEKDTKLLQAKLNVLTKMSSDYETVESLIDHSECAAKNSEIRTLYFNSLKHVDSDYEVKRALSELIVHANLNNNLDMIKSIIVLTRTMDSDYEKGEILKELAEYCRDNDELEDLYLDVADGMNSEYEARQLYEKLHKRYKTSRRADGQHYD